MQSTEASMKKQFFAVLGIVSAIGVGTSAHASLVTDSTGFPLPTSVVDFSQFAGLGYNFTAGPVDVGGLVGEVILFTMDNPAVTNSGLGAVLGQGAYGIGPNGTWGLFDQTYSGVDTGGDGSMIFTFVTPVSAVGGFINYYPDFDPAFPALIAALDSGGNVLEEYDLNALAPISTPFGENAGAFRGILRGSDDIYGFRLSSSYIVLDDLTFGRGGLAVPEPSSVVLMGLGTLLCAGVVLRRRRLA
jgi:hypothetical protein